MMYPWAKVLVGFLHETFESPLPLYSTQKGQINTIYSLVGAQNPAARKITDDHHEFYKPSNTEALM